MHYRPKAANHAEARRKALDALPHIPSRKRARRAARDQAAPRHEQVYRCPDSATLTSATASVLGQFAGVGIVPGHSPDGWQIAVSLPVTMSTKYRKRLDQLLANWGCVPVSELEDEPTT